MPLPTGKNEKKLIQTASRGVYTFPFYFANTKVATRLSVSKKRATKMQMRNTKRAKRTSGDVSLTGVFLFMGDVLCFTRDYDKLQ